MMKNEVSIGDVFKVKVTGKIVPVKIICENPHGGWSGKNLVTNKKVRIKSSAKLRSRVSSQSTESKQMPCVPIPPNIATHPNLT